ncbi:MAG: SHOCT domain-containing protein [Zoogloeaceae bacterium]|jgi:hypothetical protein|nr:SHOCT domain-containing protein [Zoogloeaceae bacterium]
MTWRFFLFSCSSWPPPRRSPSRRRARGIGGSKLTLIKVLSCIGIFPPFFPFGIAALLMTLIMEPGDTTFLDDPDPAPVFPERNLSQAEKLEELHALKEKGILSQAEFEAQKKKLLPKRALSKTEQLERLHALKEKGVITQAEFEEQKRVLLG